MTSPLASPRDEAWPALPLAEWKDTCDTLHMWTQVVGKVRLKLSPHLNQWWEVPLYVSARGLTTSPIPWGNGIFEMEFDFIDHKLEIVDQLERDAHHPALHPHRGGILSRIHERSRIGGN